TLDTGAHPYSLAVARFRAQLVRLRRLGYRSVSPLDVAARGCPAPGRGVAITFDDGYLDTLALALPLLLEFGFTAAGYVVSGAPGGLAKWTTPAPLMDWGEIREWLAAGMDIGSHSASHADLTTLGTEQLGDEVGRSKAVLEDRLGVPVRSFAYPFNRVTRAALDAVAEAGYDAGCAGAEIHRSPHALTRVDTAHDSALWFALQLRPDYPGLRSIYRALVPGGGRPDHA